MVPSDLLKRRMTPVMAMGIVNPMGPTLLGLCILDQLGSGPPELVRFSLNPFAQEVVALRGAEYAEALKPEGLLFEVGIGTDTTGTLLLLPAGLTPEERVAAAHALAFTRSDLLSMVQYLRKYPDSAWDRVSAEMEGEFSSGSEHTNAEDEGVHDEDELSSADDAARDYFLYVLNPENAKREIDAFVYAWNGSIGLQRDQGNTRLADDALPLEFCRQVMLKMIAAPARQGGPDKSAPDPAFSTGWWKDKVGDLFSRFKSRGLQKDATRPFDPDAKDMETELARCLMNRTLWAAWEEDTLLKLMYAGLYFYGSVNDGDMVQSLNALYAEIMERTPAQDRLDLYNGIRSAVEKGGTVSCNAMLPFLLRETDLTVVSTAVLDYVLLRPARLGDPLTGVKEAIHWVTHDVAENTGALLGGLIAVGDPRVLDLVEGIEDSIPNDLWNQAVKCQTGFASISTFEFWLKRLERVSGTRDDEEFGIAASALGLQRNAMKIPGFTQGLRPLGGGSKVTELPSTDNTEIVSVDEVAERYGDRMYALEAKEAPPKVMSHLLKMYGLKPRAPLSEQFVQGGGA